MVNVPGFGEVAKIPELRKRVLFTLALLAVYRLGVFVSTPGIDVAAVKKLFEAQQGTLFGMMNMFSGGALENFSIFTLGIIPYISVSIIMQFLTASIPALEAIKKEGASGQRIITRWTRQGTIALAVVHGLIISTGLESQGLVLDPGWQFRISTAVTLTAGTAFLMWIGEQITERGLGNGISLLIFAGIIAGMPMALVNMFVLARTGEIAPLTVLGVIGFMLLSIWAIVYVERAARKVPVQYPRRMVGKNVAQAQTQYMPLKLNMTGVLPPICASSFMLLPATIASFYPNETVQEFTEYFMPGHPVYTTIFVAFIFLFTFFLTALYFNPEEVAENLKKGGGFIPTVRPGKPTADYLNRITTRITLWGAIYIALVCVIPQWFYVQMGAGQFAYIFGGTAVLIVVGVALDTASQIESHVVARNYESFMSKSSKIGGHKSSMKAMRSKMLKR